MTFGDRGRESAYLGNFRTRRQTDICEMPRYYAVLSGVHMLAGGDPTGWLGI
jgi:hypothetical protein